ncbi:MAG: glycosyltransferase [Blastocatellia bacterium]
MATGTTTAWTRSVFSVVLLTGQQAYEKMPQYLWHFDACVIPFVINPVTEATDPVKLYEYLCGGKPVVSVPLPELEPYRDQVYLADSAAAFATRLDRALAEDDEQRAAARRRLASQHTWRARVELIEQRMECATPSASIVIVTYNNLALTRLCLESVIRNTAYPGYEIIVVDNASADDTPDFLRAFAARHAHVSLILNAENHGFARANNQGLARATGEALLLLNNDTIVPPGWLWRLLSHLRDPRVGLAGPMTNAVGNEARVQVDYRTWEQMEQFARAHVWAHDGLAADIHMLAMFCVAFRRRVWEDTGPLDEQFGVGMFEDDDYSLRVRALGYRVICAADVYIHHFGQASFKQLIADGAYDPLFTRNRELYERKWKTAWKPHINGRLDLRRHDMEDNGRAGKPDGVRATGKEAGL